MSSDSKVTGYVTVREFGGFRMPVPVQNLVLRNYAQSLQMAYALPQCEHKYRGSYMQLFTTLMDASPNDNIGMCSAAMLPPVRELRDRAFAIVREKKLTLHFVFERIVASGEVEMRKLEANLRIADEVRRADGATVAGVLRQHLSGAAAH